MPPTQSVNTWIKPGAKLGLWSLTNGGRVHLAANGANVSLCGQRMREYVARGVGVAVDGRTLSRVRGITRTLSPNIECKNCLEIYTTQMELKK